jgi:hypothetical protein
MEKIIIDDLNDNKYRVRRNLLIFASIGFFYKIFNESYQIKIKQIFGIIEFNEPLNADILQKGLILIILYFFIHWLVIVVEHLKFMRIRVAQDDGGRPEPGEWGDEGFNKDYPKNPTESNLHYWFNKHFQQLNLVSKEVQKYKDQLLKVVEQIENYFNAKEEGDKYFVGADLLFHIRKDIEQIKLILNKIENEDSRIHNQERLIKSINNFDNWYNCYNKIEFWRFIIIIHAFPLFLGLLTMLILI